MTELRIAAHGLILDMDGVLWWGETPMPGLDEFFRLVRRRRLPIVLASNNATTPPQQVQAKLRRMGVAVSLAEILTSSEATAGYLRQHLPEGSPVYIVGEAGLRSALAEAGFVVKERAEGVRAVVVGLDRQATYAHLTEACLAIQAGALFVGTNADVTFPMERGLAPGSGALLAAIEATTSTAPVIIGKPEPHLYRAALTRLGTAPGDTLAIGDRLETDILGGRRAGVRTALVLTGVTTREDLVDSAVHPDWVFEGLAELGRALDAAE